MAKEKEKTMSLEDVLWECRVSLRGVGSLDKNRDAVTGSQMNDDFDARLYCDKAWLSNAWKTQITDDGKLRVIAEYQKQGAIPQQIQKLFNSDILSVINANVRNMNWDKLNAETISIVEKLINVQCIIL